MAGDPLPKEQWQKVKEAFDRAVAVSGAERKSIVAAVTETPARTELEALLAAHDGADGFLERRATQLSAGRRLGPYEIVSHLGRGGMADVYRARDTRLAREVAVKVLRDDLDASLRTRFLREARAIAALSHDNVLALYDVGEESGCSYLVTELLEGETVRERLERGRPSVAKALEWTAQIAQGLAAAHDRGIVHRDLKPSNVMLVAGDRVKIVDFGVARAPLGDGAGSDDTLSVPGTIVGTIGYLAPEQARGQAVRAGADLFALGAILFELLTGRRAFQAATAADTLGRVLEHVPEPPSAANPEVPPWLDAIVARCLAKEPAERFESARDLVFALQLAWRLEQPRPGARRWPLVLGLAAALLIAAAIAGWWARGSSAPAEPLRSYPLTSSGHDRHPSVSADGKFLAFTSDRDGRARIWVQQLAVGNETPLTEGVDSAPRFSPDGSQILFTHLEGTRTSLLRVGLLGGEVHRVADDASDGDWSPDGRQVVFLRSVGTEGRIQPILVVAELDGSKERELLRLSDRPMRGRGVEQRVRWSPDGKRIAISGFAPHPGAPQHVLLVPLDGSLPQRLEAPLRTGLVSAIAWESPGTLVYSQAVSVLGNSVGSAARIVRQRLSDGFCTTLMWSPQSSLVLDRWPGRGFVLDARESRQTLREVLVAGAGSRVLSNGTATDRQPRLSPDGSAVLFASNRGGSNLDLWLADRVTGASRRLTDHPADDWDPAFTPDGRHLLWSSDRSGNFEIWIADRDGRNARQVTHDGVDAQNPTATPDGQWVVYASGAPGHTGVWRAHLDGSGATRLVPDVILPEVSPDGRYVLFQSTRDASTAVVSVATVADGKVLPFAIEVPIRRQTVALLGRARWLPDGKSIAFIGQDEQGATGVFAQAFDSERDTRATRRPLAGFEAERVAESFDVDAQRVILAETEQRWDVLGVTAEPR